MSSTKSQYLSVTHSMSATISYIISGMVLEVHYTFNSPMSRYILSPLSATKSWMNALHSSTLLERLFVSNVINTTWALAVRVEMLSIESILTCHVRDPEHSVSPPRWVKVVWEARDTLYNQANASDPGIRNCQQKNPNLFSRHHFADWKDVSYRRISPHQTWLADWFLYWIWNDWYDEILFVKIVALTSFCNCMSENAWDAVICDDFFKCLNLADVWRF